MTRKTPHAVGGRIQVVGNSGSGKSTLGKRLAKALEVDFVEGPWDAVYLHCDLPSTVRRLDDPEIAHAVHLLRPFRGGGGGEIVRRPRCYANYPSPSTSPRRASIRRATPLS